MQTRDNIKHPVLLLIRGMPGSGKSYLAAALEKSLGTGAAVMLDPDATDYQSKAYINHSKALMTEGVDASLHAYRFLRAQAHQAIADREIIIWNQPFTNLEIFHKMIAGLQTYASEHGTELPILVVEVEIDPAVAKHRVMRRKQAGGHGPSAKTLLRRINDYKSFANEGYQTMSVDGEADISVSTESVLKALRSLRKN